MCNHNYTANYTRLPKSMGKQCPYSDFYQKAYSKAQLRPEEGTKPTLPIDKYGACIFHSQEIAWKRENDFKGHFLRLLQLLEDDETFKFYNFAEFKFVGNEPRTKRGSEYHVLHISNKIFRRQAYFTGSFFLDAFELKDVNFDGGASFGQTTFVHDMSISNTRLNVGRLKTGFLAHFSWPKLWPGFFTTLQEARPSFLLDLLRKAWAKKWSKNLTNLISTTT